MRLTVNGEAREAGEGVTLRELVILVGAHPDAVAVAVNGTGIPKREHAERGLSEGDRVEVIRAVGGG